MMRWLEHIELDSFDWWFLGIIGAILSLGVLSIYSVTHLQGSRFPLYWKQLAWILRETSTVACVVEQEDHVMSLGSVMNRLPELRRQLAYWQKRFAGAPSLLALPTDRPRPAVQSFRGARHAFAFSAELTRSLQALSREAGATLFMTLLAAFETLLLRLTGQEDLVVGVPVAGRVRPETEGLVGFFVNTLAVRGDLAGDPTFREVLGRVKEAALGAYAHQELPFERLVEALHPHRDLSRSPLVQVLLDNVEMALAKADLDIAHQYSLLSEDGGEAIFALVRDEYERTRRMILRVRDAGHQVRRAGASRCKTYPKAAGQAAAGIRHRGGRALVARGDEADAGCDHTVLEYSADNGSTYSVITATHA